MGVAFSVGEGRRLAPEASKALRGSAAGRVKWMTRTAYARLKIFTELIF
jgi:hypothetical protein